MKTTIAICCVLLLSPYSGLCEELTQKGVGKKVIRGELLIEDQAAFHIHPPEKPHHIKVFPLLYSGNDLSSFVKSVTVTPGRKPFSLVGDTQAKTILFDGETRYKGFSGIDVDLFRAPEDENYIELSIDFKRPVYLQSIILSGFNGNKLWGVSDCYFRLELVGTDSPQRLIPQIKTNRSGDWRAISALPQAQLVSVLIIRASTKHKLNITELKLIGEGFGDEKKKSTVDKNIKLQKNIDSQPLTLFWQDAHQQRLGKPIVIKPFTNTSLKVPVEIKQGYYELVINQSKTNVKFQRTKFGFVRFATLNKTNRKVNRNDMFGVVHPDLKDPTLSGWVKTLTTSNSWSSSKESIDAKRWKGLIAERRKLGLEELPLFADSTWKSDSTVAISDEKLKRIEAVMKSYFEATPNLLYWELGIEENLHLQEHQAEWKFYWANLAAKFKAVRRAANAVNPKIKLVYQIANLDTRTIKKLLSSNAASHVDILALHPYAWKDFPSPEKWMPGFLNKTEELMKRYERNIPIWFTEIGAPHHGNPNPKGFFGYPKKKAAVIGTSRRKGADYLVKCNALALCLGVKKVFWYNYQDRGKSQDYAEDHFGMRDYWGFPKPAYAAYHTIRQQLKEMKPNKFHSMQNGLHICLFKGDQEACAVVWCSDEKKAGGTIKQLKDFIPIENGLKIVDVVGRPISPKEFKKIHASPLFIRFPL